MTPQSFETWTCHGGDLAFSITAPERWSSEQRAYLTEYLPHRLDDLDLGTFHLDVRIDAAECGEIVRTATHPPIARRIEPVPGVVLLEARTPSGARCYAVAADRLEQQARAYAVRVHERHIELLLHPGARKPHSYPLRLMREAMLRTYEDHGGTVFHAAGADVDGHGVMVCGPRSTGKTTLLTCLLRATHGGLLSNDRLILDRHGRLVAVPLPVPVARGTLDAVGELTNAACTMSRPQRDVRELPATFGTTAKAEFSAREYAEALGSSLMPGSWLRSIVVPRLADTNDPARVRLLSSEEAQNVLSANCFTPRDEFWIQPWLVPRRTPDAELHRNADQLVRRIAAQVPCFEVSFGVRNSLRELDNVVINLLRSRR